MRQVQNYDIENLTKRSLKTDLILDADVFKKNLKLVTITEQNYDIENLTKHSYDLTPFKTDLDLDADVFFLKI